jgi:MFS family permease
MPWRSLLIVYCVILSDAMMVFIIMPFVPDQCRKRWSVREHMVGTVSGAILGASALSSFISSFYLGHLSDLYGRKLILRTRRRVRVLGKFHMCLPLASSSWPDRQRPGRQTHTHTNAHRLLDDDHAHKL